MKELSMNYKATVDNLHSFIDQRRLFYWHSSFKHKQHYWLRSNSLKWFIYILSTTPFSSSVTLADKTAKLTADLHCGNNRCSFELSIPLKIPRQILNDPHHALHPVVWHQNITVTQSKIMLWRSTEGLLLVLVFLAPLIGAFTTRQRNMWLKLYNIKTKHFKPWADKNCIS